MQWTIDKGPDHVQVNCRLKVNCRKNFGLAWQLLAKPDQSFSYNSLSVYNSLSAPIHLYMMRALGGSEEGGEVSMLVMAKQRQILPKKNYL